MSLETTEAIILRRRVHREVDRILTLFTRDAGKVEAIARGVRKGASRLAGSLEPMTRVSVTLANGRTFPTVTGSEVLDVYRRLKADLERLATASIVAELVDEFTRPHQSDRRLFGLLVDAFDLLDQPQASPTAVRFAASWQLFSLTGFSPELRVCASCRKPLPPTERYALSGRFGGLLGPECGRLDPGAAPVTARERQAMSAALADPLREFSGRSWDTSVFRDDLAAYWVETHGSRPLRSWRFLAALVPGEPAASAF